MRFALPVTIVTVICGCGQVNKPAAPDAPTSSIDAAGASVDASSDAASGAPASCAALGATAADTNVTLYLDGDRAKPFAAHCAGTDLATYLPLQGGNTSSYPIGGCATLPTDATASVTTTWQAVRFDPTAHTIDTSDYTFSTSAGTTHEVSDNGNFIHDYQRLPFGSGRWCTQATPGVVATVDLSGTHFSIGNAQTWAIDGFSPSGGATFNLQRTTVSISIGGFPVGSSPCAVGSDYFTLMGGPCVTLDYAP